MAEYRYMGPGPQEDGDGGLIRPLDVREFDEDPGRPWEPLDEEKAAEPDDGGGQGDEGSGGAQTPATPPATPASAPPPASTPAASPGPSVTTSAPAPKTGM